MKKYFYKNNRDLENRFRLFFWGVPCGARREWAIRAFAQAAVRGFYATEQGCNPTKMKAEGIQVFTIKSELHGVGITTAQTPFGHTVPVYDMERTVCDLLRSRSRIEIQTFQGALKAYARRKDKNLRTLMQYAGMFRVEKILRQYLEVLL